VADREVEEVRSFIFFVVVLNVHSVGSVVHLVGSNVFILIPTRYPNAEPTDPT